MFNRITSFFRRFKYAWRPNPYYYTKQDLIKTIGSHTNDIKSIHPDPKKFRKDGSIYDLYSSACDWFTEKVFQLKKDHTVNAQLLQKYSGIYNAYILPNPTIGLAENKVTDESTFVDDTSTVVTADENAVEPIVSTSISNSKIRKTNTSPESVKGQTDDSPSFTSKIKRLFVPFTEADSGIKEYVIACQRQEEQYAYGEKYALLSAPEKPDFDVKLEPVKIPLLPKRAEESYLGTIPQYEITICYILLVLCLIPEYILTSQIISEVFHYENLFKKIFAGLVVILISKGLNLILLSTVYDFVKSQKRVLKYRTYTLNRFFIFCAVLGCMYFVCLGILFGGSSKKHQLAQQFLLVQQTVMTQEDDAQAVPLDAESKKQLQMGKDKMEEITKKMNDDKYDALSIFTLAFSGTIILIFSSILFCFASILNTAYKLRKKVENLTEAVLVCETEAPLYQEKFNVFYGKIMQVLQLYGELSYIERLQNHGFPLSREIYDAKKKSERIYPLNEKHNHYESAY